jgi:uncharacterized protein YciU (UPF0263 family)
MIKGKIESVKEEPFTSKAGVDLFKLAIKVNGTFYYTISKFEGSVKKGQEVMFEVKPDKETEIVIGSLKKASAAVSDVLLQRIIELEEQVKELQAWRKIIGK